MRKKQLVMFCLLLNGLLLSGAPLRVLADSVYQSKGEVGFFGTYPVASNTKHAETKSPNQQQENPNDPKRDPPSRLETVPASSEASSPTGLEKVVPASDGNSLLPQLGMSKKVYSSCLGLLSLMIFIVLFFIKKENDKRKEGKKS